MADRFRTCVVFLLGYPRVGKRTVGSYLAELLDGVLVDNQLINIPLLTLFKWDGKFSIPVEIWERVGPIREAVLGTIEDLAPKSNSYVFTNVLMTMKMARAITTASVHLRSGGTRCSCRSCSPAKSMSRSAGSTLQIESPGSRDLTRRDTDGTHTTRNCSNPRLKRWCTSTAPIPTPDRTPGHSTRRWSVEDWSSRAPSPTSFAYMSAAAYPSLT